MEVVIEVRPGRDEEVDEPAFHHLDQAAPEARRGQCTRYGQPDRGVLGGIEHFLREDSARFRQAAGVECLKAFVDELPDVGAAFGPVIANRLAGQELLLAGMPGRARGAMRQRVGSSFINVGLRPTPRLGRSRGPSAPLRFLACALRAQRGAPPHTPAPQPQTRGSVPMSLWPAAAGNYKFPFSNRISKTGQIA